MPTFSLDELSAKLGETYEGDGALLLHGVAEITTAKEGDLSFVANPKYIQNIPDCRASALIVHKDLETDFRPVIRSINPYLTFTRALTLFHQDDRKIARGAHSTSQIAESAQLGADLTVMAHAIIEERAVIGDRVVIYPGVYIGSGATIGNDVTLYPNVSIYDGCVIEDRSILHAGVPRWHVHRRDPLRGTATGKTGGGCRIGSERSNRRFTASAYRDRRGNEG